MSKKEEGLKKLRQLVKQRLQENEAESIIEERKGRELESQHLQAKKDYHKWLEKYKAPSQKAAEVIFNWYKEFIVLPIFIEMVVVSRKTYGDINISGRIERFVASPWGRGWERTQSLSINQEGQLFVHCHEKYGKSCQITNAQDLLKYVWPPILIAIAETIIDETIWDIVNIS